MRWLFEILISNSCVISTVVIFKNTAISLIRISKNEWGLEVETKSSPCDMSVPMRITFKDVRKSD